MDPQRLFGPVITRSVRIDQFDTFILNNIPYAQVLSKAVDWGAVEYDGPGTLGIDGGKPALQWHFGGVPYPITKAIQVNYTYVRRWDGSDAIITTAIYLGFQDALRQHILPQPIPFVEAPTPTFQRRIEALGTYGGFSTHSWASDAGILASEAQGVITRSLVYDPYNVPTFDTLMDDELGEGLTGLLRHTTLPVDFDGPAHDYGSHRPFEYTFATLQNEPEKYSQLLFWYFGGKAIRLTKAMRIPLDAVFGPKVLGESVVKQALHEQGKDLKPIGAADRYGQLAKEEQAREEALKALQSHFATLPKTRAERAKGLAEFIASTPPAVVPGGNALFIGFSGPDPCCG